MIEDGILTMLISRVSKLEQALAEKDEKIAALAEQLEAQEEALDEAQQAAETRDAAFDNDLINAVRGYLTWVESPPTSIDPTIYAEVLRRARANVETALRAAGG